MLFNVEIRGVRPIIHHSSTGLDAKHPANIERAELTRKVASNRTESDEGRIAELECQLRTLAGREREAHHSDGGTPHMYRNSRQEAATGATGQGGIDCERGPGLLL